MFFYNVQTGGAPYLKSLADAFDERQLPSGGPRRHRRQSHHDGQRRRFSNGAGAPEVPPNNPVDPANPGTPLPGHSSALSEVENADPRPGTSNIESQRRAQGTIQIQGFRRNSITSANRPSDAFPRCST